MKYFHTTDQAKLYIMRLSLASVIFFVLLMIAIT